MTKNECILKHFIILAPFFALLNNVLELRLDAKKVLVQHRRPIAQKVQNIGAIQNKN